MDAATKNPPDAADIASFYDATLKKRLQDYVYGNERIAAAIALASSMIDRSTTKVLEVGCGLGISAAELARGRDWLTVHAVDISPKSIAAATRLFGKDGRLVFEVSDMRDVPRMAPYDLITMLDVYEHIPRDSRPKLHAVLGEALARDGSIAITLPSPLHQDHLARENPDGLQIVDETVRLEDLQTLANDIRGEVVMYKYVSIWNSNDYIHAIIQREPAYRPLAWIGRRGVWNRAAGWIAARRDAIARGRAISERREAVRSRLGVLVEAHP